MTEGIIGSPAGDQDQDRLVRQPMIRGRRGRGRSPVRDRGWSVATIIFILVGAFAVVAALVYFAEPSVQSTTVRASRDPMPAAGQTWYAMGAPIGCRDKADLQRLTDLSQQKDPAFRTLYGEKSSVGLCKTLLDDAQVQVENSDDSGRPCVRPGGEPNCLFVIAGQLKSFSTLVDSQKQSGQ
jgi:hypothetical protein